MNIRHYIRIMENFIAYDNPFTDDQCQNMPSDVLNAAINLYSKVKGKPNKLGEGESVNCFWIETHTLGCREFAGVPEEDRFEQHLEIYDEYKNDGISIVAGDFEEGTFITVTPDRIG